MNDVLTSFHFIAISLVQQFYINITIHLFFQDLSFISLPPVSIPYLSYLLFFQIHDFWFCNPFSLTGAIFVSIGLGLHIGANWGSPVGTQWKPITIPFLESMSRKWFTIDEQGFLGSVTSCTWLLLGPFFCRLSVVIYGCLVFMVTVAVSGTEGVTTQKCSVSSYSYILYVASQCPLRLGGTGMK